MRFVEETGGSWTAEQLRAAEAEIEQQKREWEANRLAALRKAEEDEKRAQAEENDLLTYSREDAKNQVNNNKKSLKRRPVNRRLLSIKRGSTNLSKRRRAFREQTTKRTLRNNTRIVSPTPSLPHRKSASSASKSAETKRAAAAKRANSQSPKKSESSRPKRTRSETVTIVSSEEEPEAIDDKTDEDDEDDNDVDNDTDDTDHESKNNYAHKNGSEYDGGHSEPSRSEEFDDSECSLDVMIDTTDSAESNDLAQMKYSESSHDVNDEEDENDVDNDDADSPIGLRRRTPYALNRKGSAEHLNSTPANDIDNHIDANSPRTTRSHGRVKIDLWKLDVSQILPDCRQRGRTKTSSSANSNNLDISSNTNNGDADENDEALDDQDQSVNIDLTADDTDEQNDTGSTQKSKHTDASASVTAADDADDDGTGDGNNDDAENCDNSSNNIDNTNDRSKVLRQAKILDGFQNNSSVVLSRLKQTTGTSHTATITSPPPSKSSKNDKHIILKSNSASKNHKTLDSWVSISRKSPKIILNKNDCNINAVAMKTKRKTNVDVHTRNRSTATNNSKNHSDHDL